MRYSVWFSDTEAGTLQQFEVAATDCTSALAAALELRSHESPGGEVISVHIYCRGEDDIPPPA